MTHTLSPCNICPRECGAMRENGKTGVCGETNEISLSRVSLHMWEEPCISGEKGSGTVFFSGCNLGCVYCQNAKISRGKNGITVSPERLYDIFFELKEKGAHNINFVTPTHFALSLLPVIQKAKDDKIGIPFVYNTSGYEKAETLKALEGIIDVYLTDFKYMSSALSFKYSKASDYAKIAKQALLEMVRQRPVCKFSEDGILKEGVLVRHLLLPGALGDAKKVLKYLKDTYENRIFISIMNQFTPTEALKNYPEINRKVTKREYDALLGYAISIGIEQAFIQEDGAASDAFIPDFDGTGVL